MKQTVIGEIPADWKVAKLGEAGKIFSGATPDTKVTEYWNGEIAWCTPTDITALKGKVYINKTQKRISEAGLINSSASLLPVGSLVICTRATLGDCAINLIPITTNQGFKSIVPNENWNIHFLYYLINNSKEIIRRLSSGSTFLEISKKAFENIDVPFPPLPEQQKIAEILSTVDEKMAVIDEQLAQTQELKKGLMQRLLTKGIGHTAFKDSQLGEIPESWEVVKQADVATFYNGRAYKLTEWEAEGTPVIRLQNLTGSGKDYYYSNLKLPAHQYCHNGDLLYMWSATFGPVWWRGDKAIFHYHIWKIEVNAERLDQNYHYYLLDNVTARMKSQSHGSAMLHVTKGGMEKLQVAIPPVPEQRQIAEILTTLDDKLQVLTDKKAQYQELKRGLMQQLLTGQRRVKVPAEEVVLA
ncbi:restriction endonuclease subunit S [Hymenobacter jejuensis]|nr:restriction endonuclease subunit S [Hymenobacter jejuensis]